MLPYYILILVPTIIYLIGMLRGKKLNKICISMFFIILIVLLSLRSIECGTDLKMYSGFFRVFSNSSLDKVLNFSKKGEKLYYILNKIISMIGGNFQFFLFIVALMSIIPIAVLYYKKSENGILTIALFMVVAPFSMFFSGLRQSIAMGIIIFAFKYIQDKKVIKYIICVIIAMYFHKSAMFCLIFYPVYHAKITKKWLYIIIPTMIITYVFNKQIFSFLLHIYNPIYEDNYGFVTSTGQYSILILLILFIIYCFVFPDKNKINKEFMGLRNMLILSTMFQLFVPINPIVMRMNYYTLLFVPILIPKVINIGYKKDYGILQLSVIIMSIFFFVYFIYNGYTGNDVLNIFPYIPYWR